MNDPTTKHKTFVSELALDNSDDGATVTATASPLPFIHIYFRVCASLFRTIVRSILFSLFSAYLCIPKYEYADIHDIVNTYVNTHMQVHSYDGCVCVCMCTCSNSDSVRDVHIHICHAQRENVRTNLHIRSSIGVSVMQWSRRTDAYMFCTLIPTHIYIETHTDKCLQRYCSSMFLNRVAPTFCVRGTNERMKEKAIWLADLKPNWKWNRCKQLSMRVEFIWRPTMLPKECSSGKHYGWAYTF